MNIYSRRQRWKLFLIIAAVIIGVGSLWYTRELVERLAAEEKKKVETWAEATRRLATAGESTDLTFLLRVVSDNRTVPVILADAKDNIISWVNLDSVQAEDPEYLNGQLSLMRSEHEPIEVVVTEDYRQYIYYRNSNLLIQLMYFPYIQLGVISLFIVVAYLAFSASRREEQNRVWMGMAKETAHQLGTPLSSIIAWLEVLKEKNVDSEMTRQMEQDVKRLEVITERFSKIGSVPALKEEDICEVLAEAVEYLRKRLPQGVNLVLKDNRVSRPDENLVMVPLNRPLFEWVIENLCKNAADSMNGAGHISISALSRSRQVHIDVTDTGKGIPRTKFRTVFRPGFTTKQRSWGLGLSLAKRIIEDYHRGRIFIKNSETGRGTTFRIVLKTG